MWPSQSSSDEVIVPIGRGHTGTRRPDLPTCTLSYISTGSSAEPRGSFLLHAIPPLGPQAHLLMLPGVGGRKEHSPLSIASSCLPRAVDHVTALLHTLRDSLVPLGSCPTSSLPAPTLFFHTPLETLPFPSPSLQCHRCPQLLHHDTHAPSKSLPSCWGSQPMAEASTSSVQLPGVSLTPLLLPGGACKNLAMDLTATRGGELLKEGNDVGPL